MDDIAVYFCSGIMASANGLPSASRELFEFRIDRRHRLSHRGDFLGRCPVDLGAGLLQLLERLVLLLGHLHRAGRQHLVGDLQA